MQFQNRYAQQVLRQVHLWLGLVAGLFIVMMGLSGFALVYRIRLERAAEPRIADRAPGAMPLSLDVIATRLASTHPGAKIGRIVFPETAAGPLLVSADLKDTKRAQIFFDPATGQDLGEKRSIAWLDWIADLHQNLLLGKTGRALTGVIGVALLLLSASGVLSWLAGTRDWKRSLSLPQPGPWRRVNFQTHRWAGLWINALLIVISSTGIVLAWPSIFQGAAMPVQAGAQPGRGAHKPLLSLDEYIRAATAAIPHGVVREMRLASRGANSVSIAIWTQGDIRPKGGNTVLLDPASARVISVERASAASLSVKFVELANAIHKTELGGLPLQVPWSLLGFAPALLFVSGVGIWWQRRQTGRTAVVRERIKPEAVGERTLVHK